MKSFRILGIAFALIFLSARGAVALPKNGNPSGPVSGGGGGTPPPIAQAYTHNPVQTLQFINIYWDGDWDNDPSNTHLTREALDSALSAMISLGYFSGLSEYGVQSVTLGVGGVTSLLPNAKCPQKPLVAGPIYDPTFTSVTGFIQCEHDNEAILRGANVAYNVILPGYTGAPPFAGMNQCQGYSGFHYHGLQNTSLFPWNPSPFSQGSPVWTVILSYPPCMTKNPTSPPGTDVGNLVLGGLLHEMAEAATDPSPIDISLVPPEWNTDGLNSEIADTANDMGCGLPAFTPAGLSAAAAHLFVRFNNMGLQQYWSNKNQACEPSCSGGMQFNSVGVCACTGGTFNNGFGGCECPSNQPFLIKGTCQSCPSGTAFSPSSDSCVSTCPKGQGDQRGVCKVCSGGQTVQGGVCACPGNAPHFTGGQCQACPAGTVYSKTGGNCAAACPSTDYQGINGLCYPCPRGEHQVNGTSCACPSGQYDRAGTGCTPCPVGTSPNAAGTACEAPCPAGSISEGGRCVPVDTGPHK